jgi:hypothetical protein
VPLPLILASKPALAPGKIEDAEEGAGVCTYGVVSECRYIFKGGACSQGLQVI